MGSLATGLRMLDPPLSPPSTPEEICPGMAGEKRFKYVLINFLAISGDSRCNVFII
jgi:hypothetical protein